MRNYHCNVQSGVCLDPKYPRGGYIVFFLLNDPVNPPADPITVEQARAGLRKVLKVWPVVVQLDNGAERAKWEFRPDMMQKEAFWKDGN